MPIKKLVRGSMNKIIVNTFMLGVVLLACVVSWTWVELSKSGEIIATARDPLISAERGFADAVRDFNDGKIVFAEIYDAKDGLFVPGIKANIVEGYSKEYRHQPLFECAIGEDPVTVALNVAGYEYNKFYAQAYNSKLLELISSSNP
ncbi:hypothetical protein [Microbulbifer sediminum]|uniref:hypothetical protein n=1 Tax=Microbulbifer sediminum TaxID=2904250 RepID=UPI001F31E2B2|nr:hypothetical protein [Microbulbifer sediminum]